MSATIIPFPTPPKDPSWEQVLWLTIRRQQAESRAGLPYRPYSIVSDEIEEELRVREYEDLAAEIGEACERY